MKQSFIKTLTESYIFTLKLSFRIGDTRLKCVHHCTFTEKDFNASSKILTLRSGKVIDVVIPGLVEPFFASGI